MKITFQEDAWEDYLQWQEDDPEVLLKLNRLITECRRTPFSGTGKPEPLKHELAGAWSRRITQEHRLVYRVSGKGQAQVLEILQCRFHY